MSAAKKKSEGTSHKEAAEGELLAEMQKSGGTIENGYFTSEDVLEAMLVDVTNDGCVSSIDLVRRAEEMLWVCVDALKEHDDTSDIRLQVQSVAQLLRLIVAEDNAREEEARGASSKVQK